MSKRSLLIRGVIGIVGAVLVVGILAGWAYFGHLRVVGQVARGNPQIAYIKATDKGHADLYVLDLVSGAVRQITTGGQLGNFTWLSNGQDVLLKENPSTGSYGAYQRLNVSSGALSDVAATMAILPDLGEGNRNYVYVNGNALTVYDQANTRTTVLKQPYTPPYPFDTPVALSPDGRTIAFADKSSDPAKATTKDMFLMDLDGSHVRTLLATTDSAFRAIWSPNGQKLIVISDGQQPSTGTAPRIFTVVDADGTNPVRLGSALDLYPFAEWSPDGQSILFFNDHEDAQKDGTFCIAAASGTDIRCSPEGSVWFASWWPDSSQIAYIPQDGQFFAADRVCSVHLADIMALKNAQCVAAPGVQMFSWRP